MDSKEVSQRLTRIEAKLDKALEKIATHGAYIKIGAGLAMLIAGAVVHQILK